MLGELFLTGLQFLQIIGLGSIIYGVFLLIAAIAAGQGPLGFIKGALLMGFGVYIMGLGQNV